MKKVLISIMIIAVVAAIAAGGTVAYFTDEATTTASFSTGTLSLELGGDMAANVTFDNLLPGQWNKKTVTVTNDGQYDELYKLFFTGITNPDGKWLAGQIIVQLYYHDSAPEDGTSNPGWVYAGPLTGCTQAASQEYMLKVGQTESWDIYYLLDFNAGNQYQNASTTATFSVTSQQYNPPQSVTLPTS